ncbi:MAG: SRPBCC family protein [Pseudomonadota bacterium]
MNEIPAAFTGKRGDLTERAGLDQGPVPLYPYRSQAFFELERERVFRRAWLMVGRVEELADAGSFVVRQIDPCAVSALITRDKEGRVQAFHNSCSHRGSKIVDVAQGRQNRFVCPYHGWTYANDGRLANVPDERNFFDIDKANCGLKKIATEVWDGWIFVNLSRTPEVTLAEFLGPLRDHLAEYVWLGADSPVVFTTTLNANWKVVSDAFIETYHIPFIHPKTIGPTFASDDNPFGRFLTAKTLGPHGYASMYGNGGYATHADHHVERIAYQSAASVIAAAGTSETEQFLSHPAINPTGSANWSMDDHLLFPHVQIGNGPGGFWTHHFWPLTVNTCRYEGRFYMTKAANMRERFQQELYVGRVIEVILEDLKNVSSTQAGIDSGGQDFMQLQDSEICIRHNVNQIIRWVESETVKEALS